MYEGLLSAFASVTMSSITRAAWCWSTWISPRLINVLLERCLWVLTVKWRSASRALPSATTLANASKHLQSKAKFSIAQATKNGWTMPLQPNLHAPWPKMPDKNQIPHLTAPTKASEKCNTWPTDNHTSQRTSEDNQDLAHGLAQNHPCRQHVSLRSPTKTTKIYQLPILEVVILLDGPKNPPDRQQLLLFPEHLLR